MNGPVVSSDFLSERASQVLVTNNLAEFVRVPALAVENWISPQS